MFVRIASVSMFVAITAGLTVTARADVAMVAKEPTAISALEAVKLAQKGEQVSSCTKVIFNTKNARQKPVKGAAVVFVKGLPKHEDATAASFPEGKPAYMCKTKTYNIATAKFENN